MISLLFFFSTWLPAFFCLYIFIFILALESSVTCFGCNLLVSFRVFMLFNMLLSFAVWGGDPVYPTVNYIQEPDAVIDYRGPDFHEPTPNMLAHLKEVSFIFMLWLLIG